MEKDEVEKKCKKFRAFMQRNGFGE